MLERTLADLDSSINAISIQESLNNQLSCKKSSQKNKQSSKRSKTTLSKSKAALNSCCYNLQGLYDKMQMKDSILIMEQFTHSQPSTTKLTSVKESSPSKNRSTKQLLLPKLPIVPDRNSKVQSSFAGSSILIQDISMNRNTFDDSTAKEKLKKKRPKIQKHLYEQGFGQGLHKEQRYNQNRPVVIETAKLNKLGLYETGNIYKVKNIKEQLEGLKVTATKHKQSLLKAIELNQDLFSTNAVYQNEVNHAQHALITQPSFNETSELPKVDQTELCMEAQFDCDEINHEKCQIKDYLSEQKPAQVMFHLTIRNGEVEKDEAYLRFKLKNMLDWGSILLALDKVLRFLHCLKISYFRVRTDRILSLWSGKKTTQSEIASLLNLRQIHKTSDVVKNVCQAFKARLKINKMKSEISRRQSLILWVSTRFIMSNRIKKNRLQNIKKAKQMHKQLKKYPEWDTQIYLPSFSVSEFQRDTTQYMQSFETMFYQIWSQTAKNLILVIPAVNEALLKHFQNKLKLKKNISIICPDTHESYPSNLSLAATLYFSSEALQKIRTLIVNKKCVLITGRHGPNPHYELLISEYLKTPLLASLGVEQSHASQKQFFQRVSIRTPLYRMISPKSTFEQSINQLADLVHISDDKNWLLKLNDEFNGRGIASFTTKNSKLFCKGHQEDNAPEIEDIQQMLKASLKLKLKLNFENSLFMVDQFIDIINQKGGIIEQSIQGLSTYELCFNRCKNTLFLYAFKVYSVDYASKTWVSCEELPTEVFRAITDLTQGLQDSEYFGFVSIFIATDLQKNIFGMDIKPFQTQASSLIPLIRLIEDRRSVDAQIKRLESHQHIMHVGEEHEETLRLDFAKYHYVMVPNIIFTDVDDEPKSLMIEQLMQDCWGNRHLDIHSECTLYFSMGLTFSLLLVGKDLKRLKKKAINLVRELDNRSSGLRKYRGKQVVRDVFQFSDLIRALTQVKSQQA